MKHRPLILLVALVVVGLAIWRFGPGSIAPIPRPSNELPAAKRAPSVLEPTQSLPAQPARPPASTPASVANTTPNSPPPPSDAPTIAHEQQPRPAATGSPGSTAVSRIPPAVPTVPATPVGPATPEEAKPAAKFTPAIAKAELEEVRIMFQEFRNSLGENPVGNNAEITKALLGDNLKQVRLPLPKGLSVNDAGEMCDGRGVPYFFHQLSGKEMEIRSAGADQKMWTDDDVVTK